MIMIMIIIIITITIIMLIIILVGEELWRNVLLAMACVTAVVLLLLANFR